MRRWQTSGAPSLPSKQSSSTQRQPISSCRRYMLREARPRYCTPSRYLRAQTEARSVQGRRLQSTATERSGLRLDPRGSQAAVVRSGLRLDPRGSEEEPPVGSSWWVAVRSGLRLDPRVIDASRREESSVCVCSIRLTSDLSCAASVSLVRSWSATRSAPRFASCSSRVSWRLASRACQWQGAVRASEASGKEQSMLASGVIMAFDARLWRVTRHSTLSVHPLQPLPPPPAPPPRRASPLIRLSPSPDTRRARSAPN